MKNHCKFAFRVGGPTMGALALAAALGSGSVQALTIDLTPALQTVAAGSSFELALRVSGLGGNVAPSLGAFDLNVLFDPLEASFESASFGNMLDPTVSSGADAAVAGILNLFSVSAADSATLDDGQPDQITLATLRFRALAPGMTGFSISNIELGDAAGARLSPDVVDGASVKIETSQPVPDGGPGLMAAVAFGALMIARHVKRGPVSAS